MSNVEELKERKVGAIKCDLCGKFRKHSDVAGIGGEGDEEWIECKHCMSEADLERYFPEQEQGQRSET